MLRILLDRKSYESEPADITLCYAFMAGKEGHNLKEHYHFPAHSKASNQKSLL